MKQYFAEALHMEEAALTEDLLCFLEQQEDCGRIDAALIWLSNFLSREELSEWGTAEFEDAFSEVYAGEADSPEDYAEQFYEEVGLLKECPEQLRYYIDWAAVARDMFMDMYYEDGHVFYCH